MIVGMFSFPLREVCDSITGIDDDENNKSKNQTATSNIKNCINRKRKTSAIVDDVVLLYGFWAVVDADLFPARKVVMPLLFDDDGASSSM